MREIRGLSWLEWVNAWMIRRKIGIVNVALAAAVSCERHPKGFYEQPRTDLWKAINIYQYEEAQGLM
jgi:hypothetical protein